MQYTLATLKSAVVDAAIASDKQWTTNVIDRKSFDKAVRKSFPNSGIDLRTYRSWLIVANNLGVDVTGWEDARTSKTDVGPKLSELKANVLAHYQVADTKALKKKLSEWEVPFTNLRYKQSWQKLWDEVLSHYQATA